MRPRGLLVAVLIVTAFLAVGSHAQVGDCALSLSVADENPSTSGFQPGQDRTFTLEITNAQNNLPAEGELRFGQHPPGWFWDTSPRSISVAGGETIEETISISYDGDVQRDAQLRAELVEVECSSGLTGLALEGEGGPPATLAFTHDASAVVPPTEDDDNLWAWLLFGGIVVGTAVAIPVYYRRGRVNVEAFCEEPEREVVAGRGTSFPVVLRNKSSEPAHVTLEVTEVEEGWSALTTLPDLELGPKESRTLYMMVRAPDEARKGDLCVTTLQVTPENGSPETVETVARVVTPQAETEQTQE